VTIADELIDQFPADTSCTANDQRMGFFHAGDG
jgi:hypothetical protein